jgi:hypothetical protein
MSHARTADILRGFARLRGEGGGGSPEDRESKEWFETFWSSCSFYYGGTCAALNKPEIVEA